MNLRRIAIAGVLVLAAFILVACSSTSRTFNKDLTGVSTFSFGKDAPITADPIEERIIKVMEAKGYTYVPNDETGIVIRWESSEGNPFNNTRKVWATHDGKPVMAAEAENKGFGTLIAPDAAQSGLTNSVVNAIEKNIPKRIPTP